MLLKTKIFLHFFLSVIAATILAYIFIWSYLEDKFKATYFDKLTISREIKKDQIEAYFKNLKSDISLLSENPYLIDLTRNDNFKAKNYLAKYIKEKNYNNIFVINLKKQQLSYSSTEKEDISTIFLKNIYKNLKTLKREEVKFLDFKYYEKLGLKPYSFMAKTINDGDEIIGILIIEISINEINSIMTEQKQWEQSGYEKTGETYIVGEDCKMRNDSRFFIEDKVNYLEQMKKNNFDENLIRSVKQNDTTILLQEVNKEVCSKLKTYVSGAKILVDYRGVEVLSSYTLLDIVGVKWLIFSEIDKDEAFTPLKKIKIKVVSVLCALFIFALISTYFFVINIVRQLELLRDGFKSLSKGDLDKHVEILSHDEFGDLSKNFNSALKNLKNLKKSVKHYSELSEIDTLTKLFNRRKIDEILDLYIKNVEDEKFSLVMFDIDYFKKINDVYGHDVGDYALVTLAEIISKNIRNEDILARWGGEEFLIVLVNLDVNQASQIAEKLRIIVSEYNFDNFSHMSCSFGVVSVKNNDTKQSILKRVDEALYKAKSNGRDMVSVGL